MIGKGGAKSAIVGLGFSELSRGWVGGANELAVDAVRAAMADCGLRPRDVDGLLLNRSPLAGPETLPLTLQNDLQLNDLRLLSTIEAEGSTAVQMVQYATGAIRAGLVRTVACVFADAPLNPGSTGGQAFAAPLGVTGIPGWEARCGLYGAAGAYALAADEYLSFHGLSRDALGAVAMSDRAWAQFSEQAFLRKPMDLEDYRASPWVVEPFRVFDCAYPVNGAVAVVVSSARRAPDLAERPAYVHGMGQGHPGSAAALIESGPRPTGAALAGRAAYRMAGVDPSDVSACQFYEAFSVTTLLLLEAYGFFEPGAAGEAVLAGATAPGGALPCNTGGGHLSGYYLQGMTPLAEALIQIRGQGGERQLDDVALQLVTGNGGCLDYHAALLLGPEARL